MDQNKLRVLNEAKYKVHSCCGLCIHADLEKNGWGTCNLQVYDHQKHTQTRRSLSIYQYGSCDQFSQDTKRVSRLGFFKEFLAAD